MQGIREPWEAFCITPFFPCGLPTMCFVGSLTFNVAFVICLGFVSGLDSFTYVHVVSWRAWPLSFCVGVFC